MSQNRLTPDLILTNGRFQTMENGQAPVQAVAVKSGRILALGDDASIRDMAAAGTRVLNLEGRLGLPGMMDSHFHFYDWAMGRQRLELSGVTSLHELSRQVARAAQELPPGSWILGQGWNESDWAQHTTALADATLALANGFVLSQPADPSSVEVTVGGEAREDWTFDVAANSVVFDEPLGAGSEIVVDYEVRYDCP